MPKKGKQQFFFGVSSFINLSGLLTTFVVDYRSQWLIIIPYG
jgi:hypothetical protein